MWAERSRVGTRVPLNQIQSSHKTELTAWQPEILVKKEETFSDDEKLKGLKYFFLLNPPESTRSVQVSLSSL